MNPDSAAQQAFFNNLPDSPLRTILAITPVKRIMYNASLATVIWPARRHRMNRARVSEVTVYG